MSKTMQAFVKAAFVLLIGAFILFTTGNALTETEPAFGRYALAILGAFMIGAIAFLRTALFRD